MTEAQARQLLADELGRIAPDIGFEKVDPGEDLRDAFDLDSIDFLNLVTALSQRLRITIAEADYHSLCCLDEATRFLAAK